MEKQKQPYKMTARRFAIHNYTGDKAQAFIIKNREWLNEQSFLSPILEAMDQGELDFTMSYHAIKEALIYFDYKCALEKAQQQLEKSAKKREEAHDNYTITIYCKGSNGLEVGKRLIVRKQQDPDTGVVETWNDEEEMVYSEGLFFEALRKAHRMLVSESNAISADIVNNYGAPVITNVSRLDAFAETYKKRIGPMMKNMSKYSAPLRSKMKSKNDYARFSRG